MTPIGTSPETARPRVEGEREDEILDACVAELLETGYDRLTMDAVARRARAGKATLYRRWQSKQSLVVDAVIRSKRTDQRPAPDTGSLKGDLMALWSGHGSVEGSRVLGVVLTALQTDPEFGAVFRERFLAPKIATAAVVYERAKARGELRPGADPSVLGPALAGILMHRELVLGEAITPDRVERILDQVILPAATGCPPPFPQETP
jgi:AcrR family transcriptional regulator